MKKVITVGVFDYFHLGHLRLFENAKKLGDYLIVAVQDGEDILRTKPDAKVLYTTQQRIDLVKALRVVVFAIGGDQTHAGFQRAVKWCEENGKEVVRLPRTPGICSSEIKDQLETLR